MEDLLRVHGADYLVDPFLNAIQNSQPNARFEAFQREIIDEMALVLQE